MTYAAPKPPAHSSPVQHTAVEAGPPVRVRPRRRWFEMRREIPTPVYAAVFSFVLLAILGVWCLLSYGHIVKDLFLPTPTQVLSRGVDLARNGTMWTDASASLYRIMVGFLISTVVAIPLGLLMGTFRIAEAAIEAPTALTRYMPVVAFVPLSILWIGIDDNQKFFIIFLGTFTQQVLLVADNTKAVPLDLINVGSTLGLRRMTILRSIVLPAAAPGIWDTLRVTLGWAWTYLVLAELVAAPNGLGFRILSAQRYFDTATIICYILVIGVIGLITDVAFKVVGRYLFSWARTSR
jgi:NitT/TauT family transport system permease protein